MRTPAKNAAYVAVGTADLTIERLRDTVKGIARSAKQAGKMLDEMEKRGERVVKRARGKSKRSRAAALRKTRSRTGSPSRSRTQTRARARTTARRPARRTASTRS